MPTIVSLTGSWDSAAERVTLTFRVTGVTAQTVLKIYKTRIVSSPVKVVPNVLPGTQDYTWIDASRVASGDVITYRLVIFENLVEGASQQLLLPATEPSLESLFVNGGFEWLTYETILNKPKFRKTNQSRRIGLYAAAMSDMQIWVRDNIPDAAFQALCESFFPDHTPAEIKRLSYASWWWKQQRVDLPGAAPYYVESDLQPPAYHVAGLLPESRADLMGSRAVLRIHLPRYVVMPYNYWDNDEESRSLGSNGSDRLHPIPLIQVKNGPRDATSWKMWRTASRSCIMQLNRVKAARAPWPRKDWNRWPFLEGVIDRHNFQNKNTNPALPVYVSQLFAAEAAGAQRFLLGAMDAYTFSVKTGVSYVGVDQQFEKENIGVGGEWLVGCMRSDTINAIEQLAAAKGAAIGRDIVVQTEIAMVMERRISPDMSRERFGSGNMDPGEDGVALRDLTVLRNDRYYVPPLSIPFIGADMQTLTEEFLNVTDVVWTGFWRRNWAEALGRAKAFFLVQYGMQLANPNVQNYLIEFARSPNTAYQDYRNDNTRVEPVRVVIRDVADALLVREVAWALFGAAEACPSDLGSGLSQTSLGKLAQMPLPVLRYNFRSADQARENETGSTNEQFGSPGIHFLWHLFSAFYVGWKTSKHLECPAARLAQVLRLAADWGIAHAAAYIRTVEKALGAAFWKIRWDELYDEDHQPDRYVGIPAPSKEDCERFSKADRAWEEAAAKIVQEFFRDAWRQKICDYHNRGWRDADPAFRIRLVDNSARPMALQVVYCSDAATNAIVGTRMTGPDGEVPFFERAFGDFEFWISQAPLRKRVDADGEYMVGNRINLVPTGAANGNLTTVTLATVAATTLTEIVIANPTAVASGPAYRITAAATPATGAAITAVSFLRRDDTTPPNEILLTAPVTGAYETTLDTTGLKNRLYKLRARATDSLGVTTTSAAVTVKVQNELPTVTITAPVAGDVAGTVTLTATATPGAGMMLRNVQFELGKNTFGAPIPPTVGSTAFSTSMNALTFQNGATAIVAIAEDMAGNAARSNTVTVQINNAQPAILITNFPAIPVNTPINTPTFDVTATATIGPGLDVQQVQFKIGPKYYGAAILAVALQTAFTVTVNAATLKNGAVDISAVAKYTAGNEAASSAVKVTIANAIPTITLAQRVSGAYATVTATVTPGAGMTLHGVRFSVDEGPAGRLLTSAPYALTDYQLSPGGHTFDATVEDTAGNSSVARVVVTVA